VNGLRTGLLSLYSLQQSIFAPLSRFGSGNFYIYLSVTNDTELTGQHGDDTENHFLYTLNRAPSFRCLLIHGWIVSGRM
jgi:hypothetical protein